MTIATTESRSVKLGDGASDTASVPFVFLDDTDLSVSLVDASGVSTLKTLGVDYEVYGGGGGTGAVRTLSFIPAVGERLVIERQVPYTQGIDYVTNDPFPAEVAEQGLDRLTMQVQQVKDVTDRAFTLSPSVTDTVSLNLIPDAGKLLGWNAAGDALENKDLNALDLGDAVVSDYMAGFLETENEAAAQSYLGIGGGNADTLDGEEGSWYADIPARLGFTPLAEDQAITLPNNDALWGRETGGTPRPLIYRGGDNITYVGTDAQPTILRGSALTLLSRITIPNNVPYQAQDTGGVSRIMAVVRGDNVTQLGDVARNTDIHGATVTVNGGAIWSNSNAPLAISGTLGRQTLPTGFKIQWGYISQINAGSTQNANFSEAFSTVFGCWFNAQDDGAGIDLRLVNLFTTYAQIKNIGGLRADDVRWFAIGV
ncbi:hypothetical protein [uncultured Rhodospira sp.]|uniref:hypothetical protein n=1 Tax=uncultured Rhodospira sp. TaxID=1936189 RepID=UPI0026157DC6|nr:hypothetical protein [uncultured Rhodospira sp.]